MQVAWQSENNFYCELRADQEKDTDKTLLTLQIAPRIPERKEPPIYLYKH